jgi:LysM repeat protein
MAPGAAGSSAAPAAASRAVGTVDPAGGASFSLVGSYRKTMEIEAEIEHHSARYGVDPTLARAICLYESGGDANLTSRAGAEGYFQLMPATFRLLGVDSNVEAGIKYFAQMRDRFGREDLALAAYNGGPAQVLRDRPMRLETLQYVIGVSYYKNVLRDREAAIRDAAAAVALHPVQEGDTWWSLSLRTGAPILALRMYNPFLAARGLRPGNLVAAPVEPPPLPIVDEGGAVSYVARVGDIYLNLAFIFGVDPDRVREANGLWHVDLLLPGTPITIPIEREVAWETIDVGPGESLGDLAARTGFGEWAILRDNGLWDQSLDGRGQVRVDPGAREVRFLLYTVRSGDTLSAIAGRHGVSVPALRHANDLAPSHWNIRAGQVLKIPAL